MVAQRVFALADGKKLNDKNNTRYDLLMQTAVCSDKIFASPPIISRFESKIDRKEIVWIFNIFIETFINSYIKSPKEIIRILMSLKIKCMEIK